MKDDDQIRQEIDALLSDPVAAAAREAVCEAISIGLAHLGNSLWATGYFFGPDRKKGVSPFGFGQDAVVGLATVVQIGGQLGDGAVALLRASNLYAASALIRQVVEVEYLAAAFADEHEIAAEWLRADRRERMRMWSVRSLRERADGRFLASDYWDHCELGGHPSTRGRRLLPNHDTLNPGFLWLDLSIHLVSTWKDAGAASKQLLGHAPPVAEVSEEIGAAIEKWISVDEARSAAVGWNRPPS